MPKQQTTSGNGKSDGCLQKKSNIKKIILVLIICTIGLILIKAILFPTNKKYVNMNTEQRDAQRMADMREFIIHNSPANGNKKNEHFKMVPEFYDTAFNENNEKIITIPRMDEKAGECNVDSFYIRIDDIFTEEKAVSYENEESLLKIIKFYTFSQLTEIRYEFGHIELYRDIFDISGNCVRTYNRELMMQPFSIGDVIEKLKKEYGVEFEKYNRNYVSFGFVLGEKDAKLDVALDSWEIWRGKIDVYIFAYYIRENYNRSLYFSASTGEVVIDYEWDVTQMIE